MIYFSIWQSYKFYPNGLKTVFLLGNWLFIIFRNIFSQEIVDKRQLHLQV